MEEKVIDLLTGLETAIANLAPQAWTALVAAARIDALADLALVVAALAWIAVYATLAIRKALPAALRAGDDVADIGPLVFLVVGGITSVIAFMGLTMTAFSSRLWIGLLSPESQVVRDLLNKVT